MDTARLIADIVRLVRPDLPWNLTREQLYQAARGIVFQSSGGNSVS